MSDDWREELIEKMAKAAWESDGTTCDMLLETYLTEFRAALAVAEPVIREQADNALREENARLREENDAWRMDGGSCAEEVKRLREENARLRRLLVEAQDYIDDVYDPLYISIGQELESLNTAAAIREGGREG